MDKYIKKPMVDEILFGSLSKGGGQVDVDLGPDHQLKFDFKDL